MAASTNTAILYEKGDVVLLSDGIGIVHYIGPVRWDMSSQYLGVELTKPVHYGHDGYCKNHRYFYCEDKRGVLIPLSHVDRLITPEELLRKILWLNDEVRHSHDDLREKDKQIKSMEKALVTLKRAMDRAENTIKLLKSQIRQQSGCMVDSDLDSVPSLPPETPPLTIPIPDRPLPKKSKQRKQLQRPEYISSHDSRQFYTVLQQRKSSHASITKNNYNPSSQSSQRHSPSQSSQPRTRQNSYRSVNHSRHDTLQSKSSRSSVSNSNIHSYSSSHDRKHRNLGSLTSEELHEIWPNPQEIPRG